MSAYPYEVRLAPGCHIGPVAPIVSRHRTLSAAVKAARRSNRLVVKKTGFGGIVWRVSDYADVGLGPGLYGQPDRRPLSECLREAERAQAEVQP